MAKRLSEVRQGFRRLLDAWTPPPGVDLLIDFCIAELGAVVTSYKATQDSISPAIHGKGDDAKR